MNAQSDASTTPAQPEAQNAGEFRIDAVQEGSALLVGDVAVFNVGGHLCAVQAMCPHRGGPLNEGKLDGTTVTCPWHGSRFDVCTGAVLQGPAKTPVQIYRVVIEGEHAHVEKAS
jgi:nitrite reductase/ring-hydroxylating ferredoxin subunit